MTEQTRLHFAKADLRQNAAHREAVEQLLDCYAQDAMGIGRPLPMGRTSEAVAGLAVLPTARVFLAREPAGRYIGMAVCFITFSTFAGCRALNVHDLIVANDWRRRGVAGQLMRYAMEHARRHELVGKVTLEVRTDNVAAKTLYRRLGFAPGDAPYEFWTRSLP